MDKIVAVDLFCGAGGLTAGLRKAGVKVVKGIDIDSEVEKTYKLNNPGSTFLNRDISEITAEDLIQGINRQNDLFLLAGCAPCQPFSLQNRTKRRDKRKSLMKQVGRLIDLTKPDLVLVENVPGFINKKNRYHTEFIGILKKHKYFFSEGILNARDYGVPQNRRRYVLFASLRSKVSLPEATYGPGKLDYVTVKDAIAKYPRIKAGGSSKSFPNHSSRILSDLNLERLMIIPKDGGSRNSLPKALELKCHNEHNGHYDVLGRMRWDKPAPTLTCKCTSITNGRYGHPTQNRGISLREAAALQTFSDDYIFYGSKTSIAKQIGNAVPVLLAQKLGFALIATN
jgi:DNA (cytosine-5)-methyltransferase 1